MAQVSHNLAILNRGLQIVVQRSAERHDARLTEAISAEVYSWPGETERFDGSVATSPRNIIDRGDFASSQSFSVSGYRAVYRWDAEHSVYARFGFTSRSGNVFPERPFEQHANEIEPLVQILGEESRRVFTA